MSPAKQFEILDRPFGRFLAFGLMYGAEGIPYGFASVALVAFMRQQGLSIEQIGIFVAAIFLPWSFKWAWAPIIDIVRLNRFGGRKAWIQLCMTMLIVTFVSLALTDFSDDFGLLLVMVVANNFFCATLDVAIDSLAVTVLPEKEHGRGNGFMFGGQNVGIALGGGGAIFVYGLGGLNMTLAYISGMLVLLWLFVQLCVVDPDAGKALGASGRAALAEIVGTLKHFVRTLHASFFRAGNGPRLGLILSVLPIGAMALAYAIAGTLQVDYGLDNNQIAQISVYSTIAGALGCVFGGIMGDRFGTRLSLATGYLLSALPTLYLASMIATVGLEAIPLAHFFISIVLHGFVFGIGFGCRAAVLMGMTNKAVAATQFTTFMAMGNLAVSIGNYWQGVVAERIGYATALYLDAALVLLPVLLVPFVKGRKDIDIQVAAEAPAIG